MLSLQGYIYIYINECIIYYFFFFIWIEKSAFFTQSLLSVSYTALGQHKIKKVDTFASTFDKNEKISNISSAT